MCLAKTIVTPLGLQELFVNQVSFRENNVHFVLAKGEYDTVLEALVEIHTQ